MFKMPTPPRLPALFSVAIINGEEASATLCLELKRQLSVIAELAKRALRDNPRFMPLSDTQFESCTHVRAILPVGKPDTCAALSDAIAEAKIPLHVVATHPHAAGSVTSASAERTVVLSDHAPAMTDSTPLAMAHQLALSMADLAVVILPRDNDSSSDTAINKVLIGALKQHKPVIWVAPTANSCDLFINTPTGIHDGFLPQLELLQDNLDALPGAFVDLKDNGPVLEQWVTLRLGTSTPASSAAQSSSLPSINDHFRWHDQNAVNQQRAHKRASMAIWSLAAAAVFFAVAGAVWPSATLSALWTSAELATLTAILALFWLARLRQWHRRWLQSRFVSEQLRYHDTGSALLAFSPVLAMPAMNVSAQQGQITHNYEIWLLQRLLIANGMADSDDTFRLESRIPTGVAKLKQQLEDQIKYHGRKAHHNEHAYHQVHLVSLLLFGFTILCVVGHFWLHSHYLLFGTAFLPALTAALHGYLSQHEASRVAELSAHTRDRLEGLLNMLSLVTSDPGGNSWQTTSKLHDLAQRAIKEMSADTEQWHRLLIRGEAKLP